MFRDNPLTLAGEQTPRTIVYKHESHKLHQAFPVKLEGGKPEKICKGQPVALTQDGEVEPFKGDHSAQIYLGIAITDSLYPAYKAQHNFPLEVTVMVEAFAVCNYIAKAQLKCGYVKPTGVVKNDHFIEVETSATETKFICINPADQANDLVQVLIR